jgi:DNA modification methylase
MLLSNDQEFDVHLGDCIRHMPTMPAESVDFSVFSPPFPAIYAYQSSESDIGNAEDHAEMKLHLSFFYRQLARVLKPGRVAIVHVAQIPRMKRTGGVGLFDFRGFNIRIGERAGLVFEYDWVVRKNPQAQAIRSKSRELQFSGLESDRAKSRGTLPDYLLKFRAPGDNAVPVRDWEMSPEGKLQEDLDDPIYEKKMLHPVQVSRNDWIEWAECTWSDIRETDTLNVKEARSENDVKHICPLQLGVINRCVRLYSNPGEIVFSPFAGIGSEGYESLKLGRRFYGCELKPEYHATALRNLGRAIAARDAAKSELLPLFA